MVKPGPERTRKLREFGESMRVWRKAQRLTADIVAQRAGITRGTLRNIENGEGSVRFENVFAVMEVLGLERGVLEAVDPSNSARGRALLEHGLPERVRT
jgi:transcriptional regulator with XRE-family HTH domain